MFYSYEKTFKSLDELEKAITAYITYYNSKRIKAKLKGLSPVQYRLNPLLTFLSNLFGPVRLFLSTLVLLSFFVGIKCI